jgi:hypothetical protein
VAGLTLPARVASGHSIATVVPHAIMVGAMAFTMLGAHSVWRMLAASAALILTSVAFARRARTEPRFRDHIVDLWAMALVLIALTARHGGYPNAGHDHALLPQGLPGVAVVTAGWLAARTLLARNSWARSIRSAAVFLTGLASMAMFCS